MNLGSAAGGDEPPERPSRSRTTRRDALVHSALTALGELGDSATMEELAAGMGVNKAALYRYFGSRAGLHRALIGRWVSRALSDFRAAVFAGPPAAEMIERGSSPTSTCSSGSGRPTWPWPGSAMSPAPA